MREHYFTIIKAFAFRLVRKYTEAFGVAILGVFFVSIGGMFFKSKYPEFASSSIDLNQIFLVVALDSCVLGAIFIAPAILLLLYDFNLNNQIKSLTNTLKFRLVFFEFYLPLFLSASIWRLWFVIPIYLFIAIYVLAIVVLCTLWFIFSWKIRRFVYIKGKDSIYKKIKQKNIFYQIAPILLLIVLFSGYFGFIIFSLVSVKTRVINLYADGLENWWDFFQIIYVLLFPSFLIVYYRNLRSVVIAIILAALMPLAIVPKDLSGVYKWLLDQRNYTIYVKKKCL